MEESQGNLPTEIRRLVSGKLDLFNRGRMAGKERYYILSPGAKSPYYTLWYHDPAHPGPVYVSNLDLSAIRSAEMAIRQLANSFLPLYTADALETSQDSGDDIILFGKYRGYHLRNIYTIDPRYVAWIADKYEPRVKSEIRFKELAILYAKIYLDLQVRKKYKRPASGFAAPVGEKLSGLRLAITKARVEDDPYKTRVIRGQACFFVDQLLTAVDEAGNHFLLTIKAKGRSLASRTLALDAHAFRTGEILEIKSAKVLKHIESRDTRYTKIGYIRYE